MQAQSKKKKKNRNSIINKKRKKIKEMLNRTLAAERRKVPEYAHSSYALTLYKTKPFLRRGKIRLITITIQIIKILKMFQYRTNNPVAVLSLASKEKKRHNTHWVVSRHKGMGGHIADKHKNDIIRINSWHLA